MVCQAKIYGYSVSKQKWNYQIVCTFLDRRSILSEVTKLAFSITAVALMILSAGSLLVVENSSVDNSAIWGLMPLNI